MEAWRTAPLDPAIAPLCEAMNRTGHMRTIESCEGHPGRGDNDGPYIVFHCPNPSVATVWADKAENRRKYVLDGSFPCDRLIELLYEGEATWRVRGRYVHPDENARIIRALLDTL